MSEKKNAIELGGNSPPERIELKPLHSLKPVQINKFCPVNGARGKPVPGQTVKALLKVSLRLLKDGQYYFCPDPGCPVVYFSNEVRGQTFTKDQLRAAIFQKEPDNLLVPVCYCFGYSLGTIQLATSLEQKEAILADIREGIAEGQCACDLRNPQGVCCLGNVNRLLNYPA